MRGSILPVIVSAVVALAALLALLVVLKRQEGVSLIKLDVSKHVNKYMDPYEKGTARCARTPRSTGRHLHPR